MRRNIPVVIGAGDGALVVAAAETVIPATLDHLQALTGTVPVLAITANRAAVLHINPTGEDVLLIRIDDHMRNEGLEPVVDPADDLATPLKGPFRKSDEALTTAHHAAIALAKVARLLPAAVAATLPAKDPWRWARDHDLLYVEADEIFSYERAAASALTRVAAARVPLADAEDTRIIAFRPPAGGIEHLAIVIGDPSPHDPVLARIHSECFTGDLLGSLKCDCGDQLRGAIAEINRAGGGVVLYLAQEGRGIGLINKLRAYSLQDQGFDTVDANERLGFLADERLFEPAAQMLRAMGFDKVRLMTNNPDKVAGLEACGITVVERVPHAFPSNRHNEGYLATKKKRSGHYL
ncbi:MAG: GTP cyclohydrolase II [Alphaproteobacteria bacterium]|nr:MAG: GTP cyclohydrolase II [Alphaproteobacteria bacterium]